MSGNSKAGKIMGYNRRPVPPSPLLWLGRRLISQVGVEPKWLTSANARIGALRAVSNRHVEHDKHSEHWGYVVMLGVAAGMVALICFYLCVWLVRHQRAPEIQPPLPPSNDHQNHDIHAHDGDSDEMMKRAPCGDGLHAMQAWNSECVELVVMAGEHVPTFVAHPVVQHPTPAPLRNVISE